MLNYSRELQRRMRRRAKALRLKGWICPTISQIELMSDNDCPFKDTIAYAFLRSRIAEASTFHPYYIERRET